MVEAVWRRTRWYIPRHNDVSTTSRLFFLVSRFVAAIISSSYYLMESLVDDIKDQRAKMMTKTTTAMSLQSIESGERQWSMALPLVPPTNHVMRPLLPTRCWASDASERGSQLPLSVAAAAAVAVAAPDPVVV